MTSPPDTPLQPSINSTMVDPASSCPLKKLPTEVRCMVYDLLSPVEYRPLLKENDLLSLSFQTRRTPLALTQTDRLLRDEVTDHFARYDQRQPVAIRIRRLRDLYWSLAVRNSVPALIELLCLGMLYSSRNKSSPLDTINKTLDSFDIWTLKMPMFRFKNRVTRLQQLIRDSQQPPLELMTWDFDYAAVEDFFRENLMKLLRTLEPAIRIEVITENASKIAAAKQELAKEGGEGNCCKQHEGGCKTVHFKRCVDVRWNVGVCTP